MSAKPAVAAAAAVLLIAAFSAAQDAPTAPPAPGQTPSLQFESKNANGPISVDSDSIEVQQESKRVIFQGNAKATQGDASVSADTLIADYRARPQGGNEVYRVFAEGHVVMKSNTETATGETGVYDFDKAALVLEGDPVTMVSNNGSVVAHQVLQYWSNEHVAVAESHAVAEDKSKRKLFGDKLIAFFREDAASPLPGATQPAKSAAPAASSNNAKAVPAASSNNKSAVDGHTTGDIQYVQAFGNVRLETAKEIIRGDRGDYNIDSGVATVEGSVKITQNNNQLSGGFALLNVNGGTSRIFASAAQAGKPGVKQNTRVMGLIAPHTNPDTP